MSKSGSKKTPPQPKQALPKDRDSLMDALEAAFDADDAETALELTNELITRFPNDTECLCLHASALSLGGDADEALEFCGQALDAHPDSLDLIQQAVELLIQVSEDDDDALEEALELTERGCALGEKRALEAVKAGALPETDPDLMQLEEQLSDLYLAATDVLTLLGDPKAALAAADKAKALFPEDNDVLTNHASALFELCRFEEARTELEQVLKASPDDSWALRQMGLVLDHLGKHAQADALIAKAHELDPDSCPAQIKLSAKAFDKALEKALASLPDKVRDYLRNVAILAEDLPSKDDLNQAEPPLSPNSLGLFRGTPGPQQSVSDPWSTWPSAIVLYQRNLERFARDREEMEEEIAVTLLHEVGHFLGLDEAQVAALGLK